MQMCQDHWAELRAAIKEADLEPFVSKDGEAAMDVVTAQLEAAKTGEIAVTRDQFDPLMNANWAINGNALSGGGLYLMSLKEDGTHYCPLCEVRDHTSPDDDGRGRDKLWIDYAVNEQRGKAVELGLLPPMQ